MVVTSEREELTSSTLPAISSISLLVIPLSFSSGVVVGGSATSSSPSSIVSFLLERDLHT